MQKKIALLIPLLLPLFLSAQPKIHLNQAGFYVHGAKLAVVNGNVPPGNFYVLRVGSNDTLYKASLSDTISAQYSSGPTRIALFTKFEQPGNYILYVEGVGNSYPFAISNNVHHNAAVSSARGFYYQRVSMPLEEKYAGKWKRPAGHPDTEVLVHPSAASDKRPAGTVISSPGGWYDAGDYNKYIVNSGITMGTLLSAYEDFPGYFDTLKLNIPESRDKIPDLLNEIIYNLRWMLTMQDPNDGGVYHKCTNAEFDGMVMPGVTKLPRYVVAKGTAAALDFAAVTAQAYRVLTRYNKQLPGLADSCLKASMAAWDWATKNPSLAYNQNLLNQQHSPRVNTGAYGDFNFKDEWFWAASELLLAKGAAKNNGAYADTVKRYLAYNLGIPSWNNVYLLGYYSLLRHAASLRSSNTSGALDTIKTRLLAFADSLVANGGDRAYRTIMGQSRRDFIWGSSSVALNQSILLINAYKISGDSKYIAPALSNLDYVLGRNATGYCYLTGTGTKSTMHPHHRQSVADGIDEPVPGLLSGGANPGQQDRCPGYTSNLPAESYLDHDCSYSTNEIAINWNAPMVYVASALEALQFEVGYSSRNSKAGFKENSKKQISNSK